MISQPLNVKQCGFFLGCFVVHALPFGGTTLASYFCWTREQRIKQLRANNFNVCTIIVACATGHGYAALRVRMHPLIFCK